MSDPNFVAVVVAMAVLVVDLAVYGHVHAA